MTVRNARNAREIDRAESAQDTAVEDLRWVLSTDRGRRFLWDLLGDCGVHRLSFDTNFGRMAFAEGERNVGLRLQARMTAADPSAYLTAQSEAIERAERDAQRTTSDDEGDNL